MLGLMPRLARLCARLVTTAAVVAASASLAAPPSAVDGGAVLLLGEPTVARTSGLTQRMVPAGRHPANPVMGPTEAWEGVGPYIWGNRLLHDAPTGPFRLWYIAYDYAGNFYRWGYATSPDGVAWTKPALGVEQFGGRPATNLLPLGPHPEKGTRSIARDPRPDTPPDRRYLGVRFTYDGQYVSFSPDGIAWREHPQSPSWHVPSDIIHVMWDDRRGCFTAYYKLWELAGTRIDDAGKSTPFRAYMPTFTNTKRPDGAESFVGPVVRFKPGAAADVQQEQFVLRSADQGRDDGGGTSLSGAWTAKRVQAWATSRDGIHWQDEQLVLRADAQDPPTANIQYMFVMPYGGYYLGFLTMHDESGRFHLQLAWSADGIRWQRPWRQPWLDVGPAGAFDQGMVLGPADPIINARDMWFPYGGFPILHDTTDQTWRSHIGLATTRLDGFASWDAGEQPGELVTQPLLCTGDRLFVNAEAQRGSLTVEALDDQGRPIEGFESDACRAVAADTLAGDGAAGWISWRNEPNLARLQGRRIQLRFKLQNARLYSFRIADATTMHLPVPRATDR